mmetsp:Transcript_23432/g.88996  ORF Transcript_23432/g.88996 Transcript_23432/m.88996 type:complete len:98 (-) Transcript_23432:1728-2021(-)
MSLGGAWDEVSRHYGESPPALGAEDPRFLADDADEGAPAELAELRRRVDAAAGTGATTPGPASALLESTPTAAAGPPAGAAGQSSGGGTTSAVGARP